MAHMYRHSLITMAKQRLEEAAKEIPAKRLMDYVTGPGCKNALEEAITHTERANRSLI